MTARAFWLSKAVRKMAASILLLNPNRHRASDKLTKSANRNPVENNMCRNPKDNNNSKNPMKEKTKTHLDFSDLLIENALVSGKPAAVHTRDPAFPAAIAFSELL
jgi:hypothetical protein